MDRNNKKIIVITGAMLLTYLIYKLGFKSYSVTEKEYFRIKNRIKSPLKSNKLIQTSAFGWRKNPVTGQSQFHNGVDLIFPSDQKTAGQPIYAPMAGKVSINKYDEFGGNQIVVDSGYVKFGFAHLQTPSPYSVNTLIQCGQLIGYVGNTGRSTGAHLHFTMRLNDAVVDPVKNLPALSKQL